MSSRPVPESQRQLHCADCGTAFGCSLSGECWCAAEPYRLRMTDALAQRDCLCPACLRKAAAAQGLVPPATQS
jgi:hypothetical protein